MVLRVRRLLFIGIAGLRGKAHRVLLILLVFFTASRAIVLTNSLSFSLSLPLSLSLSLCLSLARSLVRSLVKAPQAPKYHAKHPQLTFFTNHPKHIDFVLTREINQRKTWPSVARKNQIQEGCSERADNDRGKNNADAENPYSSRPHGPQHGPSGLANCLPAKRAR